MTRLGDPTILKVDAVVNPTSVTSSDKSGVGGRILEAAGRELFQLLKTEGRPRTGEVRATPGFGLVSPNIIHTVGPRYSDQYYTAAESALHICYRGVLDYCFEHKLTSVVIPPIHSLHRRFPPLLGAHIALRTIRRLMMLRPQALDRIILVFDPNTDLPVMDYYLAVMKLYFPRTQEEQDAALDLLPEDVGNEFGETIVEERRVRINAAFVPSRIGYSEDSDSEDEALNIRSYENFTSYASGPTVAAGSESSSDRDAFPSSMRSMTMNRDTLRRMNAQSKAGSEAELIAFENMYSHYLALAQKTDLSAVSTLGLFYHAGTDHMHRPIIAIVGCRLPSDPALHDLVFLHYIQFMDQYANHPYIVLYIHTDMSSKSKPEISWLQKVYSIMDAKYGQSLVAIHVLHPTFWLKVVERLCSVFMSSTYVLDKIVYHDRLVDLCTTLRTVPRLPDDILQADAAINGPLSAATLAVLGHAPV